MAKTSLPQSPTQHLIHRHTIHQKVSNNTCSRHLNAYFTCISQYQIIHYHIHEADSWMKYGASLKKTNEMALHFHHHFIIPVVDKKSTIMHFTSWNWRLNKIEKTPSTQKEHGFAAHIPICIWERLSQIIHKNSCIYWTLSFMRKFHAVSFKPCITRN